MAFAADDHLNSIVIKYLAPLAADAHIRVYAFQNLTDFKTYFHFKRDDDDSASLTIPIELGGVNPPIEGVITAFKMGMSLLGGPPRE